MAKFNLDESGDLEKLAAEVEKMAAGGQTQVVDEQVDHWTRDERVQTRGALPRPMVISIIAIVAVVLIGIVWWAIGRKKVPNGFVAVPSVMGLDSGKAQETLKALGFMVQKNNDATSKAVPGQVTGQSPRPGETIQEGGTVILTVAGSSTEKSPTGKLPPWMRAKPGTTPTNPVVTPNPTPTADGNTARVVVPKIEGMDNAEARSRLEALGLRVEAKSVIDSTRQSGVVLASDPKPDTTVNRGTVIRISVNAATASSSGTSTANASASGDQSVMPNYFGKPSQTAMDDLRAKGMSPRWRVEVSQQLKSGYVIRTEPPAGSKIDARTVVTVVIAK